VSIRKIWGHLPDKGDPDSLVLPITVPAHHIEGGKSTGIPSYRDRDVCTKESRRNVDLEPPLPDEAPEPPLRQLPKQIRAPADVRGLLESLRGEKMPCAMGQKRQRLAHARLREKRPSEIVRGRLPDLPDPYPQRSTVVGAIFRRSEGHTHVCQARRPVLHEGAHAHPEAWLSQKSLISGQTTISRVISTSRRENNNLPSEALAPNVLHSVASESRTQSHRAILHAQSQSQSTRLQGTWRNLGERGRP
jgi:hypothetical protein